MIKAVVFPLALKYSSAMKHRILLPIFSVAFLIAIMAFVPIRQLKKSIRNNEQPKNAGALSANPYYIIIDKSDYELKVYDDEGWYATYPIVFGSKDLSDKMREGDKRTPTGEFKVILKKIHPKWSYELLLDYPTLESHRRFKERQQKGVIPKTARIGNGIAIHATRPEEEWTIDNFYNWTDGCVSVKYSEMKDLFSYIPVGTPVSIRP